MLAAMWGAFRIGAVVLGGALAGCAAVPVTSSGGSDLYSCAGEAELELGPSFELNLSSLRNLAPSAGGAGAPRLYADTQYIALAYSLYDAFDRGRDPNAVFRHQTLRPVAFIYGEPGTGSERKRSPARVRTLYGFVADDASTNRRYVVFRGTQEPAEWSRNLQAGQRSYPSGALAGGGGARVHAGFFKVFQSLELETPSGARTSFAEGMPGLARGRDVVFTGHSLGGALATIAGVDAARRAPGDARRMRVVTLASPRVGDAGFAALARPLGRIERVCNLADPVPNLPLSTDFIRYVHVGSTVRVSSFDRPSYLNALSRPGAQLNCWHSHQAYFGLLQPSYKPRSPAGCFD